MTLQQLHGDSNSSTPVQYVRFSTAPDAASHSTERVVANSATLRIANYSPLPPLTTSHWNRALPRSPITPTAAGCLGTLRDLLCSGEISTGLLSSRSYAVNPQSRRMMITMMVMKRFYPEW